MTGRKRSRAGLGRWGALAAVLGWHATACNGGLPSDLRPELEETGTPDSLAGAGTEPVSVPSCHAHADQGYHYADPPEFWLGSQAPFSISVRGAGYLVTRALNTVMSVQHFAPQALLSISPDGSLEDSAGRVLLGYSPRPRGGGPCLMPLRVPAFSPPDPTTRVSVIMNLDARAVGYAPFDISYPEGTSLAATSFTVIDSLGAQHGAALYFTRSDNFWTYHLALDGSELVGGTPGVDALVGEGFLQFNTDGALDIATTPQVCASFTGGATANQCFDLVFGPDISNDGDTGLAGSTQFATDTAVYALDVNGHTAGTGADVRIDASGLVTAEYDSGATLAVGTLALARFAVEAGLVQDTDGTFTATPASGPPQLGYPLGPGRGSVE